MSETKVSVMDLLVIVAAIVVMVLEASVPVILEVQVFELSVMVVDIVVGVMAADVFLRHGGSPHFCYAPLGVSAIS